MALKKYQRYLVTGIPILIVGLLVFYFSSIFSYLVLAWVVSMIGAPLHNKMRPLLGNSGAAVTTLVSFALILSATLYLFIPPILQQARNLSKVDYEKVIVSLEEPIKDWNEYLIRRGILEEPVTVDQDSVDAAVIAKDRVQIIKIDSILQRVDSNKTHINLVINLPANHNNDPAPIAVEDESGDFFDRVRSNLIQFLNPSKIQTIFSSVVGALGNTLVTIMSVFFIAFFFLKEQGLFTRMVQSVMPNESEDKWVHAIDQSAEMLKRYFVGVILQIIVITVLVSTILSILGFKYALLIGFFAALMNVIPYVGPILGATFGMIITISSNLDASFYSDLLPKLGIIAVVFGCMQMLDNFIIQPNIFSKSVKAHPLEIFIIVLMGAQLGGVVGMILAIPVYTIIRVLAKVFLSEFKVVQRITGGL